MIDTDQIKNSVNLLDLIGHDTQLKKVTAGDEYAGPCPFCGGRDRFHVHAVERWWFCRQCTSEKRGDVIAYVMQRDQVDFREAVSRLQGNGVSNAFTPATPLQPKPERARLADWPTGAAEIVTICEATLWDNTPVSRGAVEWLHGRGLNDETLKAWRVGFNPASRTIGGLWCESGIMLPYFAGGTLHAINVRRPDFFLRGHPQADKYKMIAGSKRVLYGCNQLAGKSDLVVVEGEFDAMLLWQEARAFVDVLTMGGAKSMPGGAWLAYFVKPQRFFVATDTDEAGEAAATCWLDLLGARAQRVAVPEAKDITAYWQVGGNLLTWAARFAPAVVHIGHHAAEARLLALLDRWECADDPRWRSAWVEAEIAAGLPCFETRQNERGEWFQIDAGPDGWRRQASGDSGKV